MTNRLISGWRTNFVAGLAVVLPAVISIAVVLWLFGTVANITDLLLFFLPRSLTHAKDGSGPVHWYWSVVALLLAVFLISAVGLLARNYIGKRIIKWIDTGLLRVPLLNKIYSTTKQVNDAFNSGNKTYFSTVVLIEFPRDGVYSIGFITNEQHSEVRNRLGVKVVSVFVPTTPNPTTGFLVLVGEDKVVKLDMTVQEGIKYIVTLGSVVPDYVPPAGILSGASPVKTLEPDTTVRCGS